MVTHRKFMQRGRDAEIAAKLQEQYKKEVSDQQWHLSTVREVDIVKLLLYSLKLTCRQRPLKVVVAYEPSYTAFEINKRPLGQAESQSTNTGRKTFGGFIPDIDVSATWVLAGYVADSIGTDQRSARGADWGARGFSYCQ
jgi:hypothetical protein